MCQTCATRANQHLATVAIAQQTTANLHTAHTDPVVELVLKHQPAWLNAQDTKGQTPLHLAANLNRTDVVALFLLQDNVDDSVRDNFGKTPLDVAGGPEVSTLITGAWKIVSRLSRTPPYSRCLHSVAITLQ